MGALMSMGGSRRHGWVTAGYVATMRRLGRRHGAPLPADDPARMPAETRRHDTGCPHTGRPQMERRHADTTRDAHRWKGPTDTGRPQMERRHAVHVDMTRDARRWKHGAPMPADGKATRRPGITCTCVVRSFGRLPMFRANGSFCQINVKQNVL